MIRRNKLAFNQCIKAVLLFLGIIFFTTCSDDKIFAGDTVAYTDVEVVIVDTDFEPTDWTIATHSNEAEPNFDEIFPDNEVKRLDIVVSEDNWTAMINDMTNLYGAFGSGGGAFTDDDPVFVPASVFHDDIEWYKVGVRFKGNSSLASAWGSAVLKLSFKLDFDEFEDEYPQINNQRFYGFKKLSLKNNFDDASMIREKVAADVFTSAGIAMSHTAFYEVYLDNGSGPTYFGLYTLAEEVDDTVIETQFLNDNGNLYKPDGDAASFESGTYDEDEFIKKNNEVEADFTDVRALYDIMHDATRTAAPATWRANLDNIFDTDVFLKYLAINTVIQNWDTYGKMTHNYFLYNNPETNKLTWIPWDNNESLQTGKQGGSLALDFSDLNNASWPLIGYMYNDNTYKAIYDDYVQDVANNYFAEADMQSLYATYSSLIESSATSEISGYSFINSNAEFYSEIQTLNLHVQTRINAVNNYLD